jgi:hypothetical protein
VSSQIYIAIGDTNHGWVPIIFSTTERHQHAVVYCSDVFHPFPNIKKFLGQVQRNVLPAAVKIDQESTRQTLLVRKSDQGRSLVDFAVSDGDGFDQPEKFLLCCTVKRSDLLESFDRGIARWLVDGYDVNHFGAGYQDEPACDVGKLWAKRLAKSPPREIKPYKPRVFKWPKGFWENEKKKRSA